ncbi:hypothetical protein Tco_1238769 [Tanacetum coccineum]
MAGWKPKDLKIKSFANVQELFDKAMKRVNIFVDMDTELVGEQENAKKQKVDAEKENEQEIATLKKLVEIVPNKEEVAIDAIPLATKHLSIVDWKIVKEGKISFFQIIRASRSLKRIKRFNDDPEVTVAKAAIMLSSQPGGNPSCRAAETSSRNATFSFPRLSSSD